MRSDTKEHVKVGQVLYGEHEYLDELCRGGLARAPESKAMPGAPENKRRPLPAVGADQTLSASPAAQASALNNAKPSKSGGSRKRKKTHATDE